MFILLLYPNQAYRTSLLLSSIRPLRRPLEREVPWINTEQYLTATKELLAAFLQQSSALLAPSGSILITIFEGHPYTLWNVRDLARHVGLKVGRSFRFDAAAYPGYRHARTLGNLGSKDKRTKEGNSGAIDEEDEGEVSRGDCGKEAHGGDDGTELDRRRPGAWRGEERAARTFEFVLGDTGANKNAEPTKKRKKEDLGSDSDSDD